jgi:hypothetical protein
VTPTGTGRPSLPVTATRSSAGTWSVWSNATSFSWVVRGERPALRPGESRQQYAVGRGRQDDAAPWFGGGRTYPAYATVPKQACSTGFGARDAKGYEYVLVPAHCVNLYDKRFFQGRFSESSWIGSVADWDTAFDVAYIVASTDNLSWDGPWDWYPGYTKTIVGSKKPAEGVAICTSGSASGIRCGGRIVSNYADTILYNIFSKRCQTCPMELVMQRTAALWWADQVDSVSPGGNGDSGGPAWENRPDGANAGHVVGMLLGEDYGRPCTGQIWTGRNCSKRVGVSNIVDIQNKRGLSVTTP